MLELCRGGKSCKKLNLKTEHYEKLLFFAACTAIFASCTSKKPYTITGEVDPSMNGKTVYLYDFHNARMTDSVVVAEGRFSFSGTMAGDSLRRVALDRNYVDVIVEGGDYTVDLAARTAAGSKLTEEKGRFDAQYDSIRGAFYERYRALMADASLSEETREEKADALVEEINEALGEAARPVVEANNNALGAYVFWRWSSDLETPEEFDAALALAGDYVRNFAPVKKSIATNEALKKTAEGMPFVISPSRTAMPTVRPSASPTTWARANTCWSTSGLRGAVPAVARFPTSARCGRSTAAISSRCWA